VLFGGYGFLPRPAGAAALVPARRLGAACPAGAGRRGHAGNLAVATLRQGRATSYQLGQLPRWPVWATICRCSISLPTLGRKAMLRRISLRGLDPALFEGPKGKTVGFHRWTSAPTNPLLFPTLHHQWAERLNLCQFRNKKGFYFIH
jgi:hypothetical protein